jgi:hypothetical protein
MMRWNSRDSDGDSEAEAAGDDSKNEVNDFFESLLNAK